MNVILLGLACWIATLIVTESFVFRGVRTHLTRCHLRAQIELLINSENKFNQFAGWFMEKLAYFVTCNLCVGVWFGLLLGSLYADGIVNQIVYGLAIKGIAHSAYIIQKVGERLASVPN